MKIAAVILTIVLTSCLGQILNHTERHTVTLPATLKASFDPFIFRNLKKKTQKREETARGGFGDGAC